MNRRVWWWRQDLRREKSAPKMAALKERLVDRSYDPLRGLVRGLIGR